jgi:hypothetical protein
VSLCISNIFIAIYLLRSIKRVHCPSWGRLIINYRHRHFLFWMSGIPRSPPPLHHVIHRRRNFLSVFSIEVSIVKEASQASRWRLGIHI